MRSDLQTTMDLMYNIQGVSMICVENIRDELPDGKCATFHRLSVFNKPTECIRYLFIQTSDVHDSLYDIETCQTTLSKELLWCGATVMLNEGAHMTFYSK